VSIMATAPQGHVEVAIRANVVLEVPPLVQICVEAESLHRVLQLEPVPEDPAARVVGVRAGAQGEAAHPEPLPVAVAREGDVDGAPGVVAAAARDVGAHGAAAAGAL